MQQWYKEEQQFLLQLQEAAEAHHTEHAAQKARREVEAKGQGRGREIEGCRGGEEEEDDERVPPVTLG